VTLKTSRHLPRRRRTGRRAALERAVAALACLAVASILFAFESRATGAAGTLRVWFFDVGQGDATFIVTPTGEQILIDGGQDLAVLAKLGQVMPIWDRTIDAVVATHQDADHIGGLAAVLERYDVARIVWNGDEKDTDVAAAFEAARISEPGVAPELGRRGNVLAFGDVTLTELWPDPSALRDEDANAASIVYRLDYGDTSVLLMGDATEEVENKMIQRTEGPKEPDGPKGTEDAVLVLGSWNFLSDSADEPDGTEVKEYFLDIDVLKAGHHGSATSTSYAFVWATRPEFAVVSCGEDNRYGHPHPVVLERLAGAGAVVFRTDLDGDVLLTSDGGEPLVRPAPLPF
jgi:competence protein ComEC